MSQRTFKVIGQDMVGTEMTRAGTKVTLMCAPVCWPFRRERTYERSQLLRIDGGPADETTPSAETGRRSRKRT